MLSDRFGHKHVFAFIHFKKVHSENYQHVRRLGTFFSCHAWRLAWPVILSAPLGPLDKMIITSYRVANAVKPAWCMMCEPHNFASRHATPSTTPLWLLHWAYPGRGDFFWRGRPKTGRFLGSPLDRGPGYSLGRDGHPPPSCTRCSSPTEEPGSPGGLPKTGDQVPGRLTRAGGGQGSTKWFSWLSEITETPISHRNFFLEIRYKIP